MSNFLDYPNELLEAILFDLDSFEYYQLNLIKSGIYDITNDWKFLWRKAVYKGYTNMSMNEFKERFELVVPDEEETMETPECIFKPDIPSANELYEELRIIGESGLNESNQAYEHLVEIDDDYFENALAYLLRHLKLSVTHAGERSIRDSLNMIRSIEGIENTDLTEVMILAIKRDKRIFKFLLREITSQGDIYHISETDKIVLAMENEVASSNKPQPNYDILRNLLYLADVSLDNLGLNPNEDVRYSNSTIKKLIAGKGNIESILEELLEERIYRQDDNGSDEDSEEE